jgi:hypothetical protein
MAKPALGVETGLGLEDLDAYHTDSAAALRLYFNPKESGFSERFALQSLAEVSNRLQRCLNELDLRSCLALLTRLEASFQGDFRRRCERRLKDGLSRHFRDVKKRRGTRIRLDEDILEGWRQYSSASARLIGDLRSAFRFRHWLAHGRYWEPKLGRKYDFETLFLMAEAVASGFPFES